MSGGSSRSTSNNTSIVDTDNSNTQVNDNQGVVLNIEDADDNITNLTLTDQGAVQESFEFSSDALDQAFNFGAESLRSNQEFGRDILGEAQELSSAALQVAGNAQTNAFAKIKDIAASLTQNTSSTQTLLLTLGGITAVAGLLFLAFKRR